MVCNKAIKFQKMDTNISASTNLKKPITVIIEVAAVVGAIVAIGGGYTWYKNNLWTPKVEINSVDYENGIADIVINGKPVTLLGDAAFSAGGNWAVSFGRNYKNSVLGFDTIDLTKFGNVVKYLAQKS